LYNTMGVISKTMIFGLSLNIATLAV